MENASRASALLDDGIEHHRAGRFADAARHYCDVVRLAPRSRRAWHLLGVVAMQTGRTETARTALNQAIEIDPSNADAFVMLGSVDEADGRSGPAHRAYTKAGELDPQGCAGLAGRLRTAIAPTQVAQALTTAESVCARGDGDAELLRAMGVARLRLRDYPAAAQALTGSVRIAPDADAYANLAAAYVSLDRLEESIDASNQALAIEPRHAGALLNLGIAYKAAGDAIQAIRSFEQAISAGSEAAHLNLGCFQLLTGDYHTGWPHYGWVTEERRRNTAWQALPMWDGKAAPAKRLLVCHEQGVGDTIAMARFLHRARGLVSSVTLACPAGTVDLLRTAEGVDACTTMQGRTTFSEFDLWIPTVLLPAVFDIDRTAIPHAPYLCADSERSKRFAPQLRTVPSLRVGLVWSGNPQHGLDEMRSCPLAELEPLGGVDGVTFFALQQGPACVQQMQTSLKLVPVNADVRDYADTAAIIAELDLVITVDTSVANLTGALGRPGWVMLSNRPDWRWGLAGETSPWYPTLRLFRQSGDGSWRPVVAALVAALRERASKTPTI